MTTQPKTPPGVLELLPSEQVIHDRMLERIRRQFHLFGFQPVETPVFERADVLLTKSGGETERQVYFVQSAGSLEKGDQPDLALRFDLTVPLARYVAAHEHDLTFPFRRYQIQRVYRGERSQRGRFREFYQCDIDVIGRDDLNRGHDAEVAAAMIGVLEALEIGEFTMRLNSRRLMRQILESVGVSDGEGQAEALRQIDKLENAGEDKVASALVGIGMTTASVEALLGHVKTRATGGEAIARLASMETRFPAAAELKEVVATLAGMGAPPSRFALDLSIARGLDYYTGTVFETYLDVHPELGSICSGGRYDDLAGHYTETRLPGVGLSIGFTRLFWQLREAGLLPSGEGVEVAVTLMDHAGLDYTLDMARRLRAAGVATAVSLTPERLGKQIKAADRVGTPIAIIAGEDERGRDVVAIRDLRAGTQTEVAVTDAAAHVLDILSRSGEAT